MVTRWKFPRLQRLSNKLAPHQLDHIAVGNPDRTSQGGADHGRQMCRFEWSDELSPTFIVPWVYTREHGHCDQHVAGTGEWVAAVQGAKVGDKGTAGIDGRGLTPHRSPGGLPHANPGAEPDGAYAVPSRAAPGLARCRAASDRRDAT
jgi:hypothetical protein